MKGRIIVLDRHFKIVDFDGSQEELSDVVRKEIGGWMESVHPRGLPYPYLMLVDEEGALKENRVNRLASELYNVDNRGYSPIMGTVAIMKESMTDEGLDLDVLDNLDVIKVSALLTSKMLLDIDE